MKVLYIGNYRESSGWSHHAVANILALDAAGVEVVPRPIYFGQAREEPPERILELEGNNASGADIVIQHTLPHLTSYRAGLRNIGCFNIESSNLRRSGWVDYINLLDEAWVPCTHNFNVLTDNGVKVPIEVVPMSVDINKFHKIYPFNSDLMSYLGNSYVYYGISDFSVRKNIVALLRAWYSEFKPEDNVNFLLKLNLSTPDPQKAIDQVLNEVKTRLKIKNAKDPIIIHQRLTEDEINGIHQNCDCFVSSSAAEAINIPCLMAQLAGNQIVVPRHSGFEFYVSEDVAYSVDWSCENCYGAVDTLPFLHDFDDEWMMVSVRSLREQMRWAFNTSETGKKERATRAISDVNQLSYINVGAHMKAVLEGSC